MTPSRPRSSTTLERVLDCWLREVRGEFYKERIGARVRKSAKYLL